MVSQPALQQLTYKEKVELFEIGTAGASFSLTTAVTAERPLHLISAVGGFGLRVLPASGRQLEGDYDWRIGVHLMRHHDSDLKAGSLLTHLQVGLFYGARDPLHTPLPWRVYKVLQLWVGLLCP